MPLQKREPGVKRWAWRALLTPNWCTGALVHMPAQELVCAPHPTGVRQKCIHFCKRSAILDLLQSWPLRRRQKNIFATWDLDVSLSDARRRPGSFQRPIVNHDQARMSTRPSPWKFVRPGTRLGDRAGAVQNERSFPIHVQQRQKGPHWKRNGGPIDLRAGSI